MRWAKFLMNSGYQTHYPDPYVAVGALCLFLTIPWVGLQCVIVALPGHTHCSDSAIPNSLAVGLTL